MTLLVTQSAELQILQCRGEKSSDMVLLPGLLLASDSGLGAPQAELQLILTEMYVCVCVIFILVYVIYTILYIVIEYI